MNKAARELLKQNNDKEKEILPENDEIYTNMVVYLRGADLTEYDQEVIREDLIQMILDGQNRGENIQKVMGENYKEICNGIIEAMPKKTNFQKGMDILEVSLLVISILGIISLIKTGISLLVNEEGRWVYSLYAGELFSWVIVGIVVNAVVNYVCKTAFKQKKHNKLVAFLITGCVCFAICQLIAGRSMIFDRIFIQMHIIVAAGMYLAVFGLYKIVSLRK